MKKYEEYKDSGIEWIGEIPKHWEVKILKRLAIIRSGQDHKNVYDEKGEFPIIGTGGIFGRANKFLYDGISVILGRKGTIDKPQFVESPFWCVDTAYYTNINKTVNPRLFYYLCTTINFELYKYGSAVPSITQEVLNQIPFVFSNSLDEQTAIANYLDRKTTEIDELIADKKSLLELYEEEKTAIINHAVTKGINSDAPMKDSGIEWLGEIPEHWEVKRFKYFFDLITHKSDKELPKIGLENIESKSGKLIETNSDFEGQGVHFNLKDLLFGKLRPYLAKVWLANFEGQAVGDFYVFRTKKEVVPEFSKYRLLDFSFINIINSSTYGSKMPRVNWGFIADLRIAFPSLKEQQSIVQYIKTKCDKIDAKISKTEKLITLLTEYRTALISEVVTGKIKVTD